MADRYGGSGGGGGGSYYGGAGDRSAGSSRPEHAGGSADSSRPSWSIHAAAADDDDDDGSESSGSSEDGSSGRRRQRRRQQQQRRASDGSAAAPSTGDVGASSNHTDRRNGNDQYALRLAHAMTHNPVDSLLPSPPRSPPHAVPKGSHRLPRRPVTVDDVRNRSCWICSDGDTDESGSGDGSRPDTPRRWVHPCKCTLVAHEACLLQWIRMRRSGSGNATKIVTCPQCSHPYGIVESKPALLRFFELGDKIVRDSVPIAGAGVIGGSILVVASAYGCVAVRLWMGKEATARTLGGKWPWHFFFEIPVIPFALVVARLRTFEQALAWLPFAATFPLFPMPFAAATVVLGADRHEARRGFRLTRLAYRDMMFSFRSWPPSPMMTILYAPWVRLMYHALKRRVTRKVLAPFVRRHRRAGTGAGAGAAEAGPNGDQRRVARTVRIIVGQEVPREGEDADGETVGVDENGDPRDLPPGAEAIDEENNIYVSPLSIAKLCLGALSSPLIANVMGKALLRVASLSYWMRRFLGIEDAFGKRFDLPSAATGAPFFSSSKPTPSSSASGSSRSPLANLFSTGSLEGSNHSAGYSTASARHAVLGDRDIERSGVEYDLIMGVDKARYDDLDPVWFRNAIGAGLFIVVKDAVQLGYRYLRLRHAREGAKRTKIVDRPFEGRMVEGLDLRRQPQ